MKYNFNLKRLKNKVQINIDEWFYPEGNLLKIQKLNGKASITYINQATFIGEGITNIKKDDYLLLSKVSCDVGTSPTAYYTIDNQRYFDVPVEQIMGTFKSNTINLLNLQMSPGTILFKRIQKMQDSILSIEEKNTMIGEIIKTGRDSSFLTGDKIIVRDNVSTPIKFEGTQYYAIEEKFIVGVLRKGITLEDADIINEYILLKPYISKKVLNSTILETPEIDYETLDYSDIENRDLFKVSYADKSLSVNKDDILVLNRDYTNYMYYNNEKYFVINGKKWISGKIIERDK